LGHGKGHSSFLAVDYHVLMGGFKAFPVEQDDQLLVVLAIERNPVWAGLVATDGLVQFGRFRG
jgi:hypothetical protein